MSSIHYFQRYSQPENVSTNNTLLLFSRLYHHSPSKFTDFINALLEDTDIGAGINFTQQERSRHSVPDGSISQSSFKVFIETKLHEAFSIKQMKDHLKSFGKEEFQVLLSISPKIPNSEHFENVKREVDSFNLSEEKNIIYISTTFQLIVNKFDSVLTDYEVELNEILQDYEEYCYVSKLITEEDQRMRVVPCGLSLAQNFKYKLYYDPITRGFSEHKFLGIYKDKTVKGIGKVTNIINAELNNGELNILTSTTPVTEEQRENIKNVIPIASRENGYDLRLGHKFFCVDNFYEMNFRKITKYPLQGTKFFNLKELLEVEVLPDTQEIATALSNKTW